MSDTDGLTSQLTVLHSRIAGIQEEISVAIDGETEVDYTKLLAMNGQVRALFDQEKVKHTS